MPLTDTQRDALTGYLSRNPKRCEKCGGTDWEFGEIETYAADLSATDEELKPDGLTYVSMTCRSCGEEGSVDCRKAGIPDGVES